MGKQNSPNQASSAVAAHSTQGNSISSNRPASLMSYAPNGRSVAGDAFTNSPKTDQAVETTRTNRLVGEVETSTNTATAMHDDLPGISSLDRRPVKISRNGFGWVYLLLLLLFLLWVSFKLRREWKRLHQWWRERSAAQAGKYNPENL
jgi:hypothetical protein